jgi:outer membrane protein assembly factor BamB
VTQWTEFDAMKSVLSIGVIVGVLLLAGRLPAQNGGFTDPTPPKAAIPPEMAAPAAKDFAGLKFHAAPKPLAPGAVTHDWRDFLGPNHNGISTETPLLQEFGKTGPPLVWEVPRGEGYSTPAVIGERVIQFHRVGNEEVVEALQAETGKRCWRFAYPTGYIDRYGFNNGPRCQPVSDGEAVYILGAEGVLHALKVTTGQVLWRRDLTKEFKLKSNFFGVGATPLIEGENLILNLGAPGGPSIAAFDRKTGKLAWGAGKEWGASYASPIPATVHGKRRVFVFAGGEGTPATGGLISVDPANGTVDFALPWRARVFESVNASSPVIVGDQLFLSECYGPGATVLDLLPSGGFKKAWSKTAREPDVLGTHFMTAIEKDGYLYGVDGHGPRNAPLVCIEMKTGKEMWRKEPEWETEVPTDGGAKRKVPLSSGLASLMRVDGRGLLLGQYGHLAWIDLNPKEYRELDRTHLFLARETWGMPALSRGLLYVTQNDELGDDTKPRLICYDLRGPK